MNCDDNEWVKDLFQLDYDMNRILLSIGSITGVSIQPGKTLIIFDEIQELKRGLNALKYFCENAPEYHVAVAGSLLGITLHRGESYPVGKVNTLIMHPMTYEEFLMAKGQQQMTEMLRLKQWNVVASTKSRRRSCLSSGARQQARHAFTMPSNLSSFKLYMLECGLLGAINDMPPSLMLLPNTMTESKGSFTENFVCQQLNNIDGVSVFYYSKENST